MIYEQQTNISELRHLAKAEVGKVIVGQGRATELMLVAAILMMLAVFGQIPLNDAIVGKYCADEYRSRV